MHKLYRLKITSTPRRFPPYLLLTLLLYFLFVFYLPRCTLPDFPSISPQAFLPFLSCYYNISKILESLGIMVARLRAFLKPFEHHVTIVPRGNSSSDCQFMQALAEKKFCFFIEQECIYVIPIDLNQTSNCLFPNQSGPCLN